MREQFGDGTYQGLVERFGEDGLLDLYLEQHTRSQSDHPQNRDPVAWAGRIIVSTMKSVAVTWGGEIAVGTLMFGPRALVVFVVVLPLLAFVVTAVGAEREARQSSGRRAPVADVLAIAAASIVLVTVVVLSLPWLSRGIVEWWRWLAGGA